jgi:hypothetical protein
MNALRSIQLGGFLIGVAGTLLFFTVGVILAPNEFIFNLFDLTVIALLYPADIFFLSGLMIVVALFLFYRPYEKRST